jgi:hypothetical protein
MVLQISPVINGDRAPLPIIHGMKWLPTVQLQ